MGLEWMSEETKEKAISKLNSFRVKIGYPDKWRDYSELDCKEEDSFIDCIFKCREFEIIETWVSLWLSHHIRAFRKESSKDNNLKLFSWLSHQI